MRYKRWRSNKDKSLHLLCREGSTAFEALPNVVRNMGPRAGSKERDVERLRLPYRLLLAEQDFCVIHARITKLELEAPAGCVTRTPPTPNVHSARALGACRCIMV